MLSLILSLISHPGELNAANKLRSFINDYYNIAKKHNCLLIILHHTGKRTEELAPSKSNLIGSQGFESKMRLVIEMRRDWKDGNVRHLCIVKGNYLASEFKEKSYVLQFKDRTFVNTGRRTPFSELVKPTDQYDSGSKAKERAIELREAGLTVVAVVEKLNQEGFYYGKSTIGNWVKGHPSIQKTKGDQMDGQENDPF